ncbi:DUF6274 family protein [Streptomyces sp. B1I3]|uniref:DUF6274 family protein n=1 Tax=Streptomyces sp. B1I3 TaxID=3042264 RepID=UPI00277FB8EE|nr:DUF6274 family protein [Streptomyces sp. B1I3]MDQ0794994.1 hypothetical protein [Streptomyces sp. B1I3]
MSASTARHETRALLRAHLAAASGYRHLTRRCPVCHRLLLLAMEPLTAPQPPHTRPESRRAPDPSSAPQEPAGRPSGPAGEASPPPGATAEDREGRTPEREEGDGTPDGDLRGDRSPSTT